MVHPSYRLVMPTALWDGAVGELTAGRRKLAWGWIQRSRHGGICDLLVHRLRFGEQVPNGSRLSPLEDWIVLESPEFELVGGIEERLRQSQIRQGQLLLVVQAGLGASRSEWIGFCFANGEFLPLNEIRLVGPEMPRFSRQARSARSHPEAIHSERWSRQVGAIGSQVFRRFRRTCVMIVGLGRLGSLLAESWIRAGLRDLILVDPDSLALHNLDATFGNRRRDVGRSKVEVTARHLYAINPRCRLTAMPSSINDPSVWEVARRCELVVTCVDHDEARMSAARLATEQIKIHLDLGTLVRLPTREDESALDEDHYEREILADIRLLLPRSCVACVGGLQDVAGDAQRVARSAEAGRIGFGSSAMRYAQGASASDWQSGGRTGSLASINHVAVGVAQHVWLDFLARRIQSSYWQRIRLRHGLGIDSDSGPVSGRPDCSICRESLK